MELPAQEPVKVHSRRRILLVIDSLAAGGAQRQLVNLTQEFARRGHQPSVFVYHRADFHSEELQRENVPVFQSVKRHSLDWQPIVDLYGLLGRKQFDVMLSFLPVPNLYCVVSSKLRRATLPVVVSHRSAALGESFCWRSKLAIRAYRWASQVTTNSHHFREFFASKYPALAARTTTIWNGIDSSVFPFQCRPAKVDRLRVLCIGSVRRLKRWHMVAEAVAILRSKFAVDAEVYHVGRTTGINQLDDSYFRFLLGQISKLGLCPFWHWQGEQRDMAAVLGKHDVLVHPSMEEGVPNVICEALMCGTPVIAGKVLDHPRLVQEGKTGWLFHPESAQDLALKLHHLYESSDMQRQAMGNQARAFAEEFLTIERCADEFERVLQQAINAHQR